ncbi:MAG: SDR family oxidoreductase [Proteobacteria bacterium]|nr:SDR family oxidoreductase [Pseudomonadota bacterium]
MTIRETLRGKHILLTGATGFVAKVWLAQLLYHVPEIGRITLLIRDRKTATATERIEHELSCNPAFRPLRERHGPDWGRFVAERVQVMSADLCAPRCGLRDDQVAALSGTVDLTLHCAGLTDFMPDPLAAIAANVTGATHIADLVASFDNRRLVHISTCFVVGRRDGVITESLEADTNPRGEAFDAKAALADLVAACEEPGAKSRMRARIDIGREHAEAAGFANTYTFTKSLAERLLQRRADIELAIVRPSVVECARRFPFPGWNEGINTAGPVSWLIASSFRRLPSVDEHPFDVVPVDLIGRGLTLISAAMLNGQASGVYQLSSSGLNPMSFGRCIELNGLAVRKATRDGSGNPWLRYLDPVASPVDEGAFFTVGRARSAADWLKKRVRSSRPEERLSEGLQEAISPTLDSLRSRASTKLGEASRQLRRIDAMLELFQPFTHDHDWVFVADRVAELSAQLAPTEASNFAFDIGTLDWRHYWIDVEYPGLAKWCFPLISGGTVPEDTPHEPLVVLTTESAQLSRTA